MRINLLLLIVLLLFVNNLFAQQELVTDRPDQTESSVTVPFKSLQIETGFLLESTKSDIYEVKDFAYNSTLLRYGLLENFEMRVGLEYLGSQVTGIGIDTSYNSSGMSPLYLGLKLMVREEDGIFPEIAFIGGLDFSQTANKDFASDYSAPSFRFAFSHTLSERFSIGYNIGAEWDGFTANPGYYYSFVLGAGITDNIGGFLEVYGTVPEKSTGTHLLDGGLTWLVTPVFQMDVSGGLGLNDNAIDSFISVGLTYRMDKK